MGNPFEGLRPALEVIANEAKVLPATGQALEDLMRPDHAEVVDRLRSVDDKAMDVLLETPNRQPSASSWMAQREHFFWVMPSKAIDVRLSTWRR
jgi:hypothetical protein